jgi:hypothetical protein
LVVGSGSLPTVDDEPERMRVAAGLVWTTRKMKMMARSSLVQAKMKMTACRRRRGADLQIGRRKLSLASPQEVCSHVGQYA